MTERVDQAMAALVAGDAAGALSTLAQARDLALAGVASPRRDAELARIGVAMLQVAVVSEEHHNLLRPTLAEVASRIDVEQDVALGPMWHFFQIEADLLLDDRAVEPDVDALAALLKEHSGEADSLQLVAPLIAQFTASERAHLAVPLHDIVALELRGSDPALPPELDLESWHRLASDLRQSGASATAREICDRLLAASEESLLRAWTLLTKSILAAEYGDFLQARDLMGQALDQALSAGAPELAGLIRFNFLSTFHHQGDRDGMERAARSWLTAVQAGREPAPPAAIAVRASGLLRTIASDYVALDLLGAAREPDWTCDTAAAQLAWLEAFVDVFSALAHDVGAAELCVRAITLDDRMSSSPAPELSEEDYDRIARSYELLLRYHLELERFDESSRERTLYLLEAAKEAAFSRALKIGRRSSSDPLIEERRALTDELARLEAEGELMFRRALVTRSASGAPLLTRGGAAIVVRTAREREREVRIAELKARLVDLRAQSRARVRVASFLSVTAATLRDGFAAMPAHDRPMALAYHLDRVEMELVTFLVRPDGTVEKHVRDVNAAALEALLSVLGRYPREEIEYIAERLTELLLPDEIQHLLSAAGRRPLIISGGAGFLTVPWEALGRDAQRLGLDFALCRTPSLLRAVGQRSHGNGLRAARALVVADPTEDLLSAREEGRLIAGLLERAGVPATCPEACTKKQFTTAAAEYPLVHFAGHTDYVRSDPASSYMLFSDGPLTVTELADVSFHPGAMFVLSSCESSHAGQERDSESSFGVGTTLLLKGAGAVVASNWLAHDTTTRHAAELLYQGLLRGRGTLAEVLREVRAKLNADGRPIESWALFTLLGDPFLRVNLRPPEASQAQ